MKIGIIYGLICPISKECRYVGQTTQSLKRRLYKHKYLMYKTNSHKNNWLQMLNNRGLLHNLKIEILEECPINRLDEQERKWIKKFDKLTNITDGGNVGSRGYKHTKIAKEKISERAKLPKLPISDIGKLNISKSLIGNTRHKYHKHSIETKQKISNSKKGKPSWNAIRIIQLTLHENHIRIWRSATHAAKTLNISQGNIHSVLSGTRKTAGGFKWKYENEYLD